MTFHENRVGVTIVTGAAGGMGSAAAALLAAENRSLILCDINADRLAQCAAALPCNPPSLQLLPGDLSARDYLGRLLETLGERSVDALIHTAGLSPTMGDARRMFEVNFDATVRLIDTLRPKFAAGSCAVVIASSSGYLMKSSATDALLDGLTPGGDLTALLQIAPDSGRAYALSKRAIIRFVAREAAAFGALGARIVSISPGLIDTAMGRAEFESSPQTGSMLARTPLGRLGHGAEIASVAVFLCSAGASYVSGCDIPVDGGMLAALQAL